MTIEEIRSSELLELYVLDLLSEEEKLQVDGYLSQFPALKGDVLEIEKALHQYAKSMGIPPRAGLEDQIIESVRASSERKPIDPKGGGQPGGGKGFNFMPLLGGLLALSLIGIIWILNDANAKYEALQKQYDASQVKCDSTKQDQLLTIELLRKLNDPDSKKLIMSATPGFPETQLIFHINGNSKENYIEVRKLPLIADGEVFQLWSLKEGVPPIPLSTFTGNAEDILPVDFENGTGTYAITIEPKGGSQSPNLAKLICTVGV